MGTKRFDLRNESKQSALTARVDVIDAALEPLAVLKVLVEGLAEDGSIGLWLIHMTSLPMVPRLSPFDLVFLDTRNAVVEGHELTPDAALPPLKSPSVSALILPYKTFSGSHTRVGDTIHFAAFAEETAEQSSNGARKLPRPELPPPPIEPRVWNNGHSATERITEPMPKFTPSRRLHRSTAPEEQPIAAFGADLLQWPEAVPAVHRPVAQQPVFTPPPQLEEPVATLDPEPKLEPPVLTIQEAEEPIEEVTSAAPHELTPRPVVKPSKKLRGKAARKAALKAAVKAVVAPVQPKSRSVPQAEPQLAPKPTSKAEPEVNPQVPGSRRGPVVRFLRWLYPGLYEEERRKNRRGLVPELVAYDTAEDVPQPYTVSNISSTGLYLETHKRWPIGKVVPLMLQRKGPPEDRPDRRIEVRVDAVRSDSEGVGMSFLLPEGMDWRLWGDQVAPVTAPETLVSQFRLEKALAFVRRISPRAEPQARVFLDQIFSNVRVFSAVEILMKAEELLSREPEYSQAAPELVLRILESGSWADIEWIRDLWAGLFASSCIGDPQDEQSMIFVELLSGLAPIHARILAAACAKATNLPQQDGKPGQPLYCTAEEMVRITGSTDLGKIHRSIAHLSDLGLLERSSRSSFVSQAESAKTTPTRFGLQMYARCLGYRGAA